MRLAMIAAMALTAAAPAPAPERPKAGWVDGARRLHGLSGVSLPRAAGVLALVETSELTPSGRNSVAQYRDEYGEVIGTVYVYSPALADAALTAVATVNVVLARFPDARIAEQGRVALPPGAYHRVAFASPATRSVLLVAQREGWIVKVRVTGPAGRGADVLAAADALARGIAAPGPFAAPAALPAPCAAAAPASEAAALAPETADALSLGVFSMPATMQAADPKMRLPLPARLPAAWCVESVIASGDTPVIMLRGGPAREAAGPALGRIALIADGGNALDVGRAGPTGRKDGKEATFARLSNSEGAAVLALFDGWPSAAQVAGLATRAVAGDVPEIVRTSYDEVTGSFTVQINSAAITDLGPAT